MASTDVTMVADYSMDGGGTAVNVMHFQRIGGDFDQDTVDGIVDNWKELVNAVCSTKLSTSGSYRFTEGFPVADAELYSASGSGTGSVTGDLYSYGAAFLIRLTAGAGRRRRGRIFLPGVPEASVGTGGGIEGTPSATLAAEIAEFVTDVATDYGYLLGVGSRLDGVVRGVSGISLGAYVGSQRPRLGRLSYV